MTSRYKKDDVLNKYPHRYGNPVEFNGHRHYLTEHPTLQIEQLTSEKSEKVHLYYNAATVREDELMQSIPDKKGLVELSEYEVIWEIYDCYINKRGWFYDSSVDGEEAGKKILTNVEDACDWANPSKVIRY